MPITASANGDGQRYLPTSTYIPMEMDRGTYLLTSIYILMGWIEVPTYPHPHTYVRTQVGEIHARSDGWISVVIPISRFFKYVPIQAPFCLFSSNSHHNSKFTIVNMLCLGFEPGADGWQVHGSFLASFFFIFCFSIQLTVHESSIKKFADNWIQTGDIQCWK